MVECFIAFHFLFRGKIMKDLQEHLENEFKWFHSHPELSYQEYETTKRLKELLTHHGIEVLDLPLETGLVAIIRGKKEGSTIALRSDIDALPVNEETDLEWKSLHEGKMHACGHDFHLTTIYGVALLLNEKKDQLAGNVKLIFQPAEESSLGALKIIETGVLDDVDAIFGLHSSSEFEVGTIGIKSGAVSAAVDRFEIKLRGFGTHAAHPQAGKDPIVAIGALIQSLQTIVSRNIDPFTSGLLSITHVEAGNTWNVIPETGLIEGTVRTLLKEDRILFEKRIKEITKGIALAYDVEAYVNWIAGPPATLNDQYWSDFAYNVAKKEHIPVETPESTLGGEDFAFYLEKIKGTFIKIGTGKTYPNHHPKFKVDPQALSKAATYLSQLAVAVLNQLK